MIVAIASKRGPKVEAAKKVVETIKQLFPKPPKTIMYLTYDIQGGIEMPRTLDELLTGAQHRVVSLQSLLRAENQKADFYVGMEGGFHSIRHQGHEQIYLQSWAYVSNSKEGHFGSSGNVLVPNVIANKVMNHAMDLGEVIDVVANQRDVRSKQGTWGILTRDLLTRRESFEIALTAAFAPFYNRDIYR
ncbi:MAG: DUF84 family protein [Ignavibacteria bacterium]|nr:DUF84 family protein [Ignavibacteria bacterium]